MRFIFLLLFCLSLQGTQFDERETFLLDRFFRTMFYDSEGGYVYYDEKPVCIFGIDDDYGFAVGHPSHYEHCLFREVMPVLKKLPKNGEYIVHLYSQTYDYANTHHHLLLINRKLFLQTIQENLSLFQYILGHEVTPEKLLAKLIDENEIYDSVMKYDKTLTGIILGFGAPSSIVVSRQEYLEDAYYLSENLPYKSTRGIYGNYNKCHQYFLLRSHQKQVQVELVPSFNYPTLVAEMDDVYKKIDVSSDKLVNNNPRFIFGAVKNDKNIQDKIKHLELTQDKINEFLTVDDFLPKILAKVYPQQEVQLSYIKAKKHEFTFEERKQIPVLVINEIVKAFDNSECLRWDSVIEGMIAQEKGESLPDFSWKHLGELHVRKEIKKQLSITDKFFAELVGYQKVADLLFIKPLKDANGEILNEETKVTVKLSLKDSFDNNLVVDQTFDLDLNDTFVGLAWGIKGMKKGERREILIHPKLAYGLYTTLEKGAYLKAEVELIDFKSTDDSFPKLEYISFDNIIPSDIDQQFAEVQQGDSFRLGYDLWKHYRQSKDLSLKEIIKDLKEVAYKDIPPLNQDEKDLLNRFHISLYESPSNEAMH